MIYNGRGIQVAPDITVGFDEAGQAVFHGAPGQPPPDAQTVLAAVLALRERALLDVAFLTTWKETATSPPKSAIIVAPAGAVPVNGARGPRRLG